MVFVIRTQLEEPRHEGTVRRAGLPPGFWPCLGPAATGRVEGGRALGFEGGLKGFWVGCR